MIQFLHPAMFGVLFSPSWSSAADSHLKLLDRNVRSCQFMIPDLEIDLGHRRVVSSLCMLYKIYHNPRHPLNSELSDFFQQAHITRYDLRVNSITITLISMKQSTECMSKKPLSTPHTHLPIHPDSWPSIIIYIKKRKRNIFCVFSIYLR